MIFTQPLHKHSGKFILFEGVSGSGKSTQAKLLYERLLKDGVSVAFNREPSSGVFGRIIRAVIEGKDVPSISFLEAGYILKRFLPNRADLYIVLAKLAQGVELTELERQTLFVLDRLDDIVSTIFPALKSGKVVVQDRYDLSTYAYCAANSDSTEVLGEIADLHEDLVGSSYVLPDLIFILDCPAEVAVTRLASSGKEIDRYEHESSLRRVRDQYVTLGLELAVKTNVYVLDGTESPEKIHERIVLRVKEHGIIMG